MTLLGSERPRVARYFMEFMLTCSIPMTHNNEGRLTCHPSLLKITARQTLACSKQLLEQPPQAAEWKGAVEA